MLLWCWWGWRRWGRCHSCWRWGLHIIHALSWHHAVLLLSWLLIPWILRHACLGSRWLLRWSVSCLGIATISSATIHSTTTTTAGVIAVAAVAAGVGVGVAGAVAIGVTAGELPARGIAITIAQRTTPRVTTITTTKGLPVPSIAITCLSWKPHLKTLNKTHQPKVAL